MLEKRFLEPIKFGGGLAQPLNRKNLRARDLTCGSKAGTYGFAVHKNGAGAAIAGIATDLSAG
jgi:hypothetical protein